MVKFVTTRDFAGQYKVTQKGDTTGRIVEIIQVQYPGDGTYWIADAKWVRDVISDPMDTKREAVAQAQEMLLCWDENGKEIG